MIQSFADPIATSIPLYLIDKVDAEAQIEALGPIFVSWAKTNGFSGARGTHLVVPDDNGKIAGVLVGQGTEEDHKRHRFIHGNLPGKLPEGTYHFDSALNAKQAEDCALSWLLGSYRFDRYKRNPTPKARLVCPVGCDADRIQVIAEGEALTRDLINTPTSDMGPAELEVAARNLAQRHGAELSVLTGDALIKENFPMVHTVGRASIDAPRLIDMRWGTTGPKLTLVGKGVCFDTGGLNIKPGASMGLMKKDMGGAANVLGLAHMIMALSWGVRLRVLIPAVENSISDNAFRPGDVLTSRKGLTVEINNTDAEGRLVLADALALADEEKPECIISMATLTGAARVAVGPDLAPYFSTDDAFADQISRAGTHVSDPTWRLPFWDPYEDMIEPDIADLDNAPKGGFAGAVTAALFLRRFVTDCPSYTHFDVYGWQPVAAPARPKGGVGQGARALLDALPKRLGL